MKTILYCAWPLLALAVSASAEIFGVEQFDYSDGAVAGQSGGTFWDYKNFAPTGHTGTASTWDNVTGAPVVTSGRLVTDNSRAKREYNGALESDGAVKDPTSVPNSVAKSVYYRVTFTTGATVPSFISISSLAVGTEIVSFGVSMDLPNDNKFSIRVHPVSLISNSSTLATPNTTYTLVTRLDYVNNVASIWLNPDLNAAEGSQIPLRTASFTPTNSSTAVRLASGTGGVVNWDNLVVATTWNDLGTVVTTTADEDTSLDPAAGTGVSLREAVKYSPSGTLVTFAPALSGKTITLTGGELAPPAASTLTIDASGLPLGLTVDANNTSRLFSVDSGQTLTLRSLTLTGGNGDGATEPGLGGALYNTDSTLRVFGCTLTGNRAGLGGAVYSDADLGSFSTSLTHCTIAGNSATLEGGALYNFDGRTFISACTISGNTAPSGGGALASFGDTFTETRLDHTIVSANTGGDVEIIAGSSNSFISQGHNLIGNGDATGDFTQLGDQTTVTNPKLSPLGYFGGPTMTMHLLIGSPAIDAGGPTDPGGLDQRGFPRFVDGDTSGVRQVDIGAVEAGELFVVNTTADVATGLALRNVLSFFPMLVPPGTRVGFDPSVFPATITLNGSELAVAASSAIFLDASNLSGPVTISGNNASRVFNIAAGTSVAMYGLSIIDGKAPNGANATSGNGAGGGHGGGIQNSGTLSLISCSIANNRTGNGGSGSSGGNGDGGQGGSGGGVFSSGPLTLASCNVTGNQTGSGGSATVGAGGASGGGGGISSSGPLTLVSCNVTGNQTGSGGNGTDASFSDGGHGGGIFSSGLLNLVGCSIAGNKTGNGGNISQVTGYTGGGGDGGGIYGSGPLNVNFCGITGNRTGNAGSGGNSQTHGGNGGGIRSAGSLILTSSSVSNNTTGGGGDSGPGGFGGGVHANGATVRVSTIAGNQAAEGGGIYSQNALTFEHSTIAGNSAATGGGIRFSSPGPSITLRYSVVAGNVGGSQPDDLSNVLGVTYQGANFVGIPNGNGSGPAPLTGNPLLAPVGDYGGPTQTMPPLPASPVINAATGSTATTDQRGYARVATPDLGATEAGFFVTNTLNTGTGSLRKALLDAAASANPGPEPILFAPALSGGVITLASELAVNDAAGVIVDASNAPLLSLSGGTVTRVFRVLGGSTATVRAITIRDGNSSLGGGIRNEGILTLERCTLTGSRSPNSGGAIENAAGSTLVLDRCTIAGNSATGNGGAMFNSGSVVIRGCTLVENSTTSDGGGIYNAGTISVASSIIAGNFLSVPTNRSDLRGTAPTSLSGNLLGENFAMSPEFPAGQPNARGDFVGTPATPLDPRLNLLGKFGGPTQTMPPLAGSHAIDIGINLGASTDQRGLARIADGNNDGATLPDSGAVEAAFRFVTNTNDTGPGSLRQALADAAAAPGWEAIAFVPALNGGAISLTTSANGSAIEVADTGGVVIDASSLPAGLTITKPAGAYRLFRLYNSGRLSLHDLTLTGGGAPAVSGGAISNDSGDLLLTNCTLFGNTGSTGGAMILGGGGAALLTTTLLRCTISGNSATGRAGGLYSQYGLLVLTHCTISGNNAPPNAGGGVGGRAVSSGFGTTVEAANTIIAGNSGGDVQLLDGATNYFVSQGHNLIGDGNATGAFSPAKSDIIGITDPLLAPLDNYGGSTKTMAVKPGSPARDAANGSPAMRDQRSFPIFGTADIGAYEAGMLTNFANFIWETLPATATIAQHATTFDFDGDGAKNIDEWLALTDPGNPASLFRITSVTKTGNNLFVTFPTVAGRIYRYDSSTDLLNWTSNPGGFQGDGNPLTIFLGVSSSTPRFFIRLRVGP